MTGILARTAGNIVNPAVTALMQAAAIATGNVDLALWANPVGAAAGSLTEEGAVLVRRAWSGRRDRVEQFANFIEEETNAQIDDLLKVASDDPRVLKLLAVTVQSVTDARDVWKIRTLAKVFVRGATDPAQVDELVYLAETLAEVDGPDARLLAVLRHNRWMNPGEMSLADPGLGPAVVPIARKLVRLGLVGYSSAVYGLTDLGMYCANRLNEVGAESERGSNGF